MGFYDVNTRLEGTEKIKVACRRKKKATKSKMWQKARNGSDINEYTHKMYKLCQHPWVRSVNCSAQGLMELGIVGVTGQKGSCKRHKLGSWHHRNKMSAPATSEDEQIPFVELAVPPDYH